MYASEFWGTVSLDEIEMVHMMAFNRFLGVPLRTPKTRWCTVNSVDTHFL